jgi:hypothetical protein
VHILGLSLSGAEIHYGIFNLLGEEEIHYIKKINNYEIDTHIIISNAKLMFIVQKTGFV